VSGRMPSPMGDPGVFLRRNYSASCARHTDVHQAAAISDFLRGVDLALLRFACRIRFLKFLAHRRNRVTHCPDGALQIVGGYMKPLFQASNLIGVSQVNLVANGRRLDVAHPGRLRCCRPIALADDLFRYCQITGQGRWIRWSISLCLENQY
jgi:hypothetical protein